MKKLLALLLTGAMAVGMLAGCGSSDSSTDKAEDSTEAADSTDEAAADDGEKAEIYVFIKNRGDLSYWDSMAEGGDRAATELADKANVHVIETTEDLQANLTAMYEAVSYTHLDVYKRQAQCGQIFHHQQTDGREPGHRLFRGRNDERCHRHQHPPQRQGLRVH